MFNHEADESVTCDESCNNEQDNYYCMFVFLHVILILSFRMQHRSYQAAVLRGPVSDCSYLALL